MSVFRAHAKMVEDVLMGLINITAGVLMALLGSTVSPTLMNAWQPLVFMEGVYFFLFSKNKQKNVKMT